MFDFCIYYVHTSHLVIWTVYNAQVNINVVKGKGIISKYKISYKWVITLQGYNDQAIAQNLKQRETAKKSMKMWKYFIKIQRHTL